MERKEIKVLLGATQNQELVFGEFGITYINGYPQFAASFDTIKPFIGNDYDLEEYFEEWQKGLDKEYLYDQCVRFDCKPSELAKELAGECYDVRDTLDCSLYPECYEVDGESWYFESGNCGQYDSRKDMEIYTNQSIYDKLHELWDVYHLKKVDNDVIAQVENLAKMCKDIQEHEEEWIIDYIRKNIVA